MIYVLDLRSNRIFQETHQKKKKKLGLKVINTVKGGLI